MDMLPIPGFPGYLASRDGRIWSTWRRTWETGRRGSFFVSCGEPKELALVCRVSKRDNATQVMATIFANGKRHCKIVSRLVLLTFVGPCPEGMECCHNDGDATNNCIDNLRWDTRASNEVDRSQHGKIPKGSTHGNALINEAIAAQIKRRLAAGLTRQMVATELDVSIHIVSDIKRKRAWRHVVI